MGVRRGFSRGVLCFVPQGVPQAPPSDDWRPSPAKPRPPNVVRQRPQEGTMRERRDHGPQTNAVSVDGGPLQRANSAHVTRPVIFGTMAGGENPRPGRPGMALARCLVDDITVFEASRPGGVSGYPRAWYRSVSRVRIPPSAYSNTFVGTFVLGTNLTCGKRESVSSQHSMENRRAVGLLNPVGKNKLKARTGGRRDDTCDHGLSRSWKVNVCEKKKRGMVKAADDFISSWHRAEVGDIAGYDMQARTPNGWVERRRENEAGVSRTDTAAEQSTKHVEDRLARNH